jgi:hypothetical protein
LVWQTDDPRRTARVADRWRARLAHPHLPRTLAGQLTKAGFLVEGTAVFVILEHAGTPGSYSRLQADHMAQAVSNAPSAHADETAAWLADLARQATAGSYFAASTATCSLPGGRRELSTGSHQLLAHHRRPAPSHAQRDRIRAHRRHDSL